MQVVIYVKYNMGQRYEKGVQQYDRLLGFYDVYGASDSGVHDRFWTIIL